MKIVLKISYQICVFDEWSYPTFVNYLLKGKKDTWGFGPFGQVAWNLFPFIKAVQDLNNRQRKQQDKTSCSGFGGLKVCFFSWHIV